MAKRLGAFVQSLEPRRLMTSGLFAPPIDFGDRPMSAVTTGDFDGNGTVDIAAAGANPVDAAVAPGDAYLLVLLNDGAGGFSGTITPLGVGRPVHLVAAHLNDDGREDLAITRRTNFSSLFFKTYASLGDGGFADNAGGGIPPLLQVNSELGIAGGDFDGDGRRELVVDNTVLFRSAGAFSPVVVQDLAISPRAADINGDGLDDLLWRNVVWLNDGTGHFITPAGGGGPDDFKGERRWASADFDHDGDIDQVNGGTGATDDGPNLFYNRGDNTFVLNDALDLVTDPSVPVVGDFDGDGNNDVALAAAAGGGAVFTLLGRGDGTFRPGGSESVASVADLAAADFNADGRPDLVTAGGPGVRVFLGGGTPGPIATFGQVGASKVPSVTTTGGASSRPESVFTLKGPGTGRVYDTGAQAGLRLVLDGTTPASSLTIRTPRDSVLILLGIQVNGSLRSVTAASTGIFGDVTVAGTVRSINLAGAAGGSRVTIAGAGVPTAMTFFRVQDLIVTTQSPVSRLTAYQWFDRDPIADVITAPSVGSVVVRRPPGRAEPAIFQADVSVAGGPVSIKTIDVRGVLENSVIRTSGSIGSVRVETLDDSTIYAGVAPTVATIPTSAAELTPGVSIGSVRVGVVNDTIRVAASTVRRYQSGRVNTSLVGAPGGLFATFVGSYSRLAAVLVHKTRLSTPGVFDGAATYVARIVG